MSVVEHQWHFLQDLSELIWHVEVQHPDWQLTGGELWRNSIMQSVYRQLGLSWTSNSRHLDRLAIDLNLFISGQYITDGAHPAYQELGRVWEELDDHNRWGVWKNGRQVDGNHFERRLTPRPDGYAWPTEA